MTLQLAFIGAGALAEPYLDALRSRRDIALAGVCDSDRRTAEQVAAGWGARVFADAVSLLRDLRPDAVWVCLPARQQGEVMLRVAEAKVPFFAVPPGAVDFERAVEVAHAVEAAGLVTAVGFPGRDADVVREAREYLGANVVPMALGWWLAPPRDTEAHASVLGQLWNEAAGLIDGLRFFCGEVTRVRALAAGPAGQAGGMMLQLEFALGTIGMLTCAAFARPEPRIELELLGEGWSLRFGADLATLRLDEHDKTTILRCLNNPAGLQTTRFLEAVVARNPAAVAVPYGEALKTLAVCRAAALSALENRPVALASILRQEPDAPDSQAKGDA